MRKVLPPVSGPRFGLKPRSRSVAAGVKVELDRIAWQPGA